MTLLDKVVTLGRVGMCSYSTCGSNRGGRFREARCFGSTGSGGHGRGGFPVAVYAAR